MKKTVAGLLTFVLLFSGFFVQVQADTDEVSQIVVNYAGTAANDYVLKNNSGIIFAPMEWISYYGAEILCKKDGSLLTYYAASQKEEKSFAKRIFIDEEKGEFAVGIYFEDDMLKSMGVEKKERLYDHYYPLYEGSFSSIKEYDNKVWVPLTELLPLMDVKAAVEESSGMLCMEPVVMTTLRALYENQTAMEEQLFDADKMVGKDVMTGVGGIISTIMDMRFDRLDILYNSGRINDYESIFAEYLKENESYLSLFESDTNLVSEYLKAADQIRESFDSVNNVLDVEVGVFKELYQILANEAVNPEYYTNIVESSGDLIKAGSIICSFMEFANAYCSQIEDHRSMLGSVYHYELEKDTSKSSFEKVTDKEPSFQAADTIQKLYDTKASHVSTAIKEAVEKVTYDLLNDAIKDTTIQISAGAGGWFIAVELTKIIVKEDYEYVKNSALIGLVDNTVKYANNIYGKRLKDADFSYDAVNKLRLSAMMSMVGSGFAYETYWGNSRKDDVEAIDEILKDLYIAGIYPEYDTADTYEMLYEKYRNMDSDLQTVNSNAEVAVELGIMTAAVTDMVVDQWLEGYTYTVADGDKDGYNELFFKYYTTDAATQMYWTALDPDDDMIANEIYENDKVSDGLIYDNCDMSRQFLYGSTEQIVDTLDNYLVNREGYLFTESTDVNGDGNKDFVYALYGAGQMWNSRTSGSGLLYFYDKSLTLVTVEQAGNGVYLQVNHLRENAPSYHYSVDQMGEDLLRLSHSTEGEKLTIGEYIYIYDAEAGGYRHSGWNSSKEDTYSLELALSFAQPSIKFKNS